jgi:hypothetical protein
VVQHAHLDQRQRGFQPLRDARVGRTGLGHAGRVVVGVMFPDLLCALPA